MESSEKVVVVEGHPSWCAVDWGLHALEGIRLRAGVFCTPGAKVQVGCWTRRVGNIFCWYMYRDLKRELLDGKFTYNSCLQSSTVGGGSIRSAVTV